MNKIFKLFTLIGFMFMSINSGCGSGCGHSCHYKWGSACCHLDGSESNRACGCCTYTCGDSCQPSQDCAMAACGHHGAEICSCAILNSYGQCVGGSC